MSEAIGGPGFLLQLGSASGDAGSFTTIAEVKDITGPQMSVDVIDVTNQDSPGGFEEIMTSIRRAGDVDFDVNFNPANATHDATAGLIYLETARIKRGYRLWLQDTGHHYWAFNAYVVQFQTKAPVANVLSGTVKLRITGQPLLKTGAYPS